MGGEKLWKQKSNLKELPILKMTLSLNSCCSDLNDSRCYYLLKTIIEGITAIKCQELVVLNSEVVTMMKEKMDQFNEDEELVLAASKRQLVKIQHHQEKIRIRQEGKEEGELLKAKENTLMLFKSKYPQEDILMLENLTLSQYNEIFKALIENKNLQIIKEMIK